MTIRTSQAVSRRCPKPAVYALVALVMLSTGCAGPGGRAGPPVAPMPPSTSASAAASDLSSAVILAIVEERKTRATYENMTSAFGAGTPFKQIAESEANHTAALERLAGAHGIALPTTSESGAAAPANLRQACQMGVDAEIADIQLYDKLLPTVSAYLDAVQVFSNLRSASQDRHLPAFRSCA